MIVFKLPSEFIGKHKDLLETWDWARQPKMVLAEALPDEPALADAVLEAVAGSKGLIVRSLGAGSAVRIRRYAETLEQHEKPSAEEVVRTLKRRNPETPD